jgi:hypothetical protein
MSSYKDEEIEEIYNKQITEISEMAKERYR